MLLSAPPLARAPGTGERIDAQQRAFREELETQVPSARVGWRYRLVANGFSLTLPADDVARLGRLHGVRDVLPAGSYAPQAASTPQQIGAPALWGPTLDTAGQGVKIGIIDSGIDPEHPYFDPAGYTMPPGFPKGQLRFTTAKVIVARSFAPKTGATAPSVRLAFSEDDIVSWDARRGDRRRERRYSRRRPSHLGSCSARVPRQLQGLRRDRRRPEPQRQLTGDRRCDRGRRRRRHGRHQLLGR